MVAVEDRKARCYEARFSASVPNPKVGRAVLPERPPTRCLVGWIVVLITEAYEGKRGRLTDNPSWMRATYEYDVPAESSVSNPLVGKKPKGANGKAVISLWLKRLKVTPRWLKQISLSR